MAQDFQTTANAAAVPEGCSVAVELLLAIAFLAFFARVGLQIPIPRQFVPISPLCPGNHRAMGRVQVGITGLTSLPKIFLFSMLHYSPGTTSVPIQCAAELYRVDVGGVNASDCGPCPAGYICQGSRTQLCPKVFFFGKSDVFIFILQGFYCPRGSGMIPCDIGRYQPTTGQGDIPCLPCLPGYWCNLKNLSSVEGQLCPAGYFWYNIFVLLATL